MQRLIPKPMKLYDGSGAISLPPVTNINVESPGQEVERLGAYFASFLAPAVTVQVTERSDVG